VHPFHSTVARPVRPGNGGSLCRYTALPSVRMDRRVHPLTDKSTILRFRHRLEKNKLSEQMLEAVNDILQTKGLLLKHSTLVDATSIAAPSSTKNWLDSGGFDDAGRDRESNSFALARPGSAGSGLPIPQLELDLPPIVDIRGGKAGRKNIFLLLLHKYRPVQAIRHLSGALVRMSDNNLVKIYRLG